MATSDLDAGVAIRTDVPPPRGLSLEPLTPTSFLERSAAVFGDRTAIIDGGFRATYRQMHQRCRALAAAVAEAGVAPGDRVAVLSPNTRLLLESHFGVPYAGAVLVALNHRLADHELRTILEHSGARMLLVDTTFQGRAGSVVEGLPVAVLAGGEGTDLDARLWGGDGLGRPVDDERSLLSINYTSGTTGVPKGVMYHHRGAYLQALAMVHHTGLGPRSVMLWTLPMFHCNGWCFTWATSAAGAVNLCLPAIDAGRIWHHIRHDGVTHLNAAPTVLTMLANDPAAADGPAPQRVHVATGGAPPSPTLLEQMAALNFEVTHLYGLTETFGPAVVCEWQPAWDGADAATTARLVARQGVGNLISQRVRVVAEDGSDVPPDGETLGEVALRGNNVMLGYYRAPDLTAAAAPDGWFRTGDLAVLHGDGYIELKDRAKDIIISGGENIASVEVEQALQRHPAVLEAAVVAMPDPKWGEVPVAYVTLRAGATASSDELIAHVRSAIAHYMAPRRVVITDELPKTSTGKIQKHVLRARLRNEAG